VRSLARQRIVEQRDARAVELLRADFGAGTSSAASDDEIAVVLERLWALQGCGAADREIVEQAFTSPSAVVRTHALRVAERGFDSVMLASLLSLVALVIAIAVFRETRDPANKAGREFFSLGRTASVLAMPAVGTFVLVYFLSIFSFAMIPFLLAWLVYHSWNDPHGSVRRPVPRPRPRPR
jgi:hypothetical protein